MQEVANVLNRVGSRNEHNVRGTCRNDRQQLMTNCQQVCPGQAVALNRIEVHHLSVRLAQ
jgi:hypothetical protein